MKDNAQLSETWRVLALAHTLTRATLETRLKADGLPELEVYQTLNALAQSEADLTAKDLETALMMPQYGVSRLLDRMEKDGLLSRITHPKDQRAKLVRATEQGQTVHAQMQMIQDQTLADFLGSRIRPGQMARVIRLLTLITDTESSAEPGEPDAD